MTDHPQFFDFTSEEYQALRQPYDIASSESNSALVQVERLRSELRAAELRYHTARAKAAEYFNPLNAWYKAQSKAQDEWRKKHREAERDRPDEGQDKTSAGV